MVIQVNQNLLADDEVNDDGTTKLPEGVYSVADWDAMVVAKTTPADRVELFRVNERVYTAPKKIPGQVMFRFMRATRKAGADDAAPVANLMYDVLGDAVMDAMADEQMSDEEFAAVMKVVEKHTAGAAKKSLGK